MKYSKGTPYKRLCFRSLASCRAVDVPVEGGGQIEIKATLIALLGRTFHIALVLIGLARIRPVFGISTRPLCRHIMGSTGARKIVDQLPLQLEGG